jgi:type IV pilus assembly protein PilW
MTAHRIPIKLNPRRRTAGLSLVELMVAMVVGFLILAAMLSAYSSGSSSNAVNARYAEVQTNGRYAVDFLRREIQQAGFLGINYTGLSNDSTTATTDALCGSSIQVTNIAQPIWGANDAKTLTCIADADYSTGDVLVLRRVEPLSTSPTIGLLGTGSFAANTAYVRSEFMKATAFVGTTPPANVQIPYEDYKLKVDIYYVSPYTNTAGDGVPALKRLKLGTGPAFTSEVIATGIENMQIQYGVQTGGAVVFLNANSVPSISWPNIVAVRLWVLARSSDRQYEGFSNTSTYAMGDLTGDTAFTVNDNFVRQLFPLVVQVRK